MALERIHIYDNPDELANGLAAQLVTYLVGLQRDKSRINIGLTGSEAAEKLYIQFSRLAQLAQLDRTKLEIWWTSEMWVPTTDPQRNSTRVLTHLAQVLPDSSQVHPMPSSTGTQDPAEAALRYATELGNTVFDFVLLDLGSDGHVAGIYPDHPSFEAQSDPTATVIGVEDAPDYPQRVTLTLSALNQANEIWVIAAGEDKCQAISKALRHDPSIPASFLHATKTTRWFLDEAAASQIERYSCMF